MIAIIGGGLSGLMLANFLQQHGIDFQLFEARSRLGGRILSKRYPDDHSPERFDLGPSWVWPEFQPRLKQMTQELGLLLFDQWDEGYSLYQAAPNSRPEALNSNDAHQHSKRIRGGAYALIEALSGILPSEKLHLDHRLLRITERTEEIEITLQKDHSINKTQCDALVTTLPPRLLAADVIFEPEPGIEIMQAMRNTPTWMAGVTKIVARYDKPFWRELGLSGNAAAPFPGSTLPEVYDASSEDGKHAALFGFLGLPASFRAHYQEQLERRTLQQLVQFFGERAKQHRGLLIQDWYKEPFTATKLDSIPLTAHPPYGHPLLQRNHWNGKLYFGGTETSETFGGYLEGAIEAARRVAELIVSSHG